MSNVWHRIPCCRSKWELKHGKGGGEKKDPFFMKITYLGDGDNPVNFLIKTLNAFGNTYSLDESSINKMTLDGSELTFENLTLSNLGLYGGTYDIYQYNFGDNSEHELIIYSDSLETLRFSPWFGGPPTSPSHYFKNITKIEISNNVTNISSITFYGCTNLSLITIPNSILTIGGSAFYDCSGLEKVIVKDIAAWYNISFSDVYSNPLFYAHHLYSNENTEITDLVIPNSVTSIGANAFAGCTGLTSVEIPNSVTSIGQYAFDGTAWYINQPDGLVYAGKVAYKYKGTMPNNTHITLLEGTLGIADYAFSDCRGLTSVEISNSVTSIGSQVFYGCKNLTSIVVESGNMVYDSREGCNAIIETQSNKLVYGCNNTIIPNSVTSIYDNAFYNCNNITSVTIGNNVTNIGNSAFQNCSNLEFITSLATIAPTIQYNTFKNVKTDGTLIVPTGSTGYDTWMGIGNYYLGKYNWTKVEQ